MKVDNTSAGKPAAVRRRSGVGARGQVSFADALEGSAEAGAVAFGDGVGAPSAAAPVDTLLALQATAGPEGDAAAARAKKRAEDLLRRLDLLRLDLLTGGIPRERLIGLAQSLKTLRDQTFDPRLNDILDDIELRAQVELAKYDPYR